MATKESYPIYSMICYTVVAVGLYSIYANYTDRNPDAPKSKQVVQTREAPKQSATPVQKMSFEDRIATKVAKDSIDQGMIALNVKDYVVACVNFGVASAAVLSTKRQDDYVKMRDLERMACKMAGIDG